MFVENVPSIQPASNDISTAIMCTSHITVTFVGKFYSEEANFAQIKKFCQEAGGNSV